MTRRSDKLLSIAAFLICLFFIVRLPTNSPQVRTVSNDIEVYNVDLTEDIKTNDEDDKPEIINCDSETIVIPEAFGALEKIPLFPNQPPKESVRYGTIYGGFSLPKNLCWLKTHGTREKPLVVYGFGVGEDCSWDIAMSTLSKNIEIHMFDPTPRAKLHFEVVMKVLDSKKIPERANGENKEKYINPINGEVSEISGRIDEREWFAEALKSGSTSSRFHFHYVGLWTSDTTLEFSTPQVGVSGSFVAKIAGNKITVPARKLETLMKENGHQFVDVLKFDIEGAEVQVVPHLIDFFTKTNMWPRLILFDHDSARNPTTKMEREAAESVLTNLKTTGKYEFFSYNRFDVVFVRNY